MTAEENKQILRRAFAELSQGDSKPFVGLLAEEVRWTVLGATRWSKTCHGKQSVA